MTFHTSVCLEMFLKKNLLLLNRNGAGGLHSGANNSDFNCICQNELQCGKIVFHYIQNGGSWLCVVDDSNDHMLSVWDWQREDRLAEVKVSASVFSIDLLALSMLVYFGSALGVQK